jgi:hypothetical protein
MESAINSVSQRKARSPKWEPPCVRMVAVGCMAKGSFTFYFPIFPIPKAGTARRAVCGRLGPASPSFAEASEVSLPIYLEIRRTKSGRNCALRPAHADKITGRRSKVSILLF